MQKPWPASTVPCAQLPQKTHKILFKQSVIQSKRNLILFGWQSDLVSIDFDIFASQAALKINKNSSADFSCSSHIFVILVDVLFDNLDSEFEI